MWRCRDIFFFAYAQDSRDNDQTWNIKALMIDDTSIASGKSNRLVDGMRAGSSDAAHSGCTSAVSSILELHMLSAETFR